MLKNLKDVLNLMVISIINLENIYIFFIFLFFCKMSYKSKYSKLMKWIKENINKNELSVFDNNFTKCEYVFSKIPLELLSDLITTKQLYQILYKLEYINSNVSGDKNERLNWITEHSIDILDINCYDSKETNNLRIDYVMNKMNEELKTNYSRKQIRNFLNNQNLLSKYFSMKHIKNIPFKNTLRSSALPTPSSR